MQWRRVRASTPLSIAQSPRPSSATTPAARSCDRCGVPDSGTSKEKSAPPCARFGRAAGLLHARKAWRNQSSFLLRFSRVKAEILETQNEYFYAKSLFEHGFTINSPSTPPQMPVGSCISRSDGDAAHYKIGHIAALLTKSLWSALPTKKDAYRRHPACFIILFRFNAVAGKRQWPSAASKPRRRTRAKLCSRFCFRRTTPRLFQITSGTPCGRTDSGGAAARRCCDPAPGRRGRGQDTSVRQYPSVCAVRSAALTECRTENRPTDTSQ